MEEAVIGNRADPVSSNDNHPLAQDRQRRWFGPAGIALAASLALTVMAGGALLSWQGRPGAPAGQVMSLSDGSIATLQPGAQISFAQADGARKVTLLRGAATFQVAKDRAHPFVVRSGDVYAQATGTIYSVARIGETGGNVHVREGSVLVWARDERDQAVLLHAGGRLALEPGVEEAPRPVSATRHEEKKPPLPPPPLAQISLDNVPISAAVSRFNRVNDMKIVIADPAIGEIRIVGLFRANDPEQFAEAAAAVANGKVVHRDGKIVISMK
jgi:transmembrane sensor